MKATEELKHEHRATERMLDLLDRICDRLEDGLAVEPNHLVELLDFIRTFTDQCHHGKEEAFLFPAMEEAGVEIIGGPIGVMLQEHEIGRAHVEQLANAIGRYRAGDRTAAGAIVLNARAYVRHLRQHIEKEDKVLFPMAEASLTPEQDAFLIERFAEVEQDRVGAGRHEAFHEMLDRLSKRYPETRP